MSKIINGIASEYDMPMKYENKTMTIEVKNDEMLGRTTDSTLHIELIKLQQENKELKEKVDYLKNKCENKDKWCQLIANIGYDYDGYREVESLMKLIDELVKCALFARDNYDYDAFQEEGNNE